MGDCRPTQVQNCASGQICNGTHCVDSCAGHIDCWSCAADADCGWCDGDPNFGLCLDLAGGEGTCSGVGGAFLNATEACTGGSNYCNTWTIYDNDGCERCQTDGCDTCKYYDGVEGGYLETMRCTPPAVAGIVCPAPADNSTVLTIKGSCPTECYNPSDCNAGPNMECRYLECTCVEGTYPLATGAGCGPLSCASAHTPDCDPGFVCQVDGPNGANGGTCVRGPCLFVFFFFFFVVIVFSFVFVIMI